MAISIGIPFYNAEKYLADAIRSVFAQTYQDWELLLVDDGSTDRSLEIARAVKDPRVRVLSDGENKKLPSRLNQIAVEAKYDFVARMDADDLMSPTRLEKQMAVFATYPELDLVTSGVFSVTNELKPVGVRWHDSTRITLKELLAKRGCGVVHAAILARKSWFLRNPYDPTLRIAQDYDLWLRSAARDDFNIHLLQEPLYYYREENNATAKKMLAAYKNERVMYGKYGKSSAFPLILRSWCKSTVVQILSGINQMDLLLKRRSASIDDPDMLALFQNEIEQVKNTSVPGLD